MNSFLATRSCRACGRPFQTAQRNAWYCSDDCRPFVRKPRACHRCGASFRPSDKGALRVYCSEVCKAEHVRPKGYVARLANCKRCNAAYSKTIRTQKYCNSDCYPFSKKTRPCRGCGKAFKPAENRGLRAYCTVECKAAFKKPDKTCPGCEKPFQASNHNKIYCCRACSRTVGTCQWCSKVFECLRIYVARGQYLFCSDACRHTARRKGLPQQATHRTCLRCGSAFQAGLKRGKAGRSFCSIACRRQPRAKCIRCGKSATKHGNTRFCSVSCYRKHTGETGLEQLVREALQAERIPFEQEAPIGRWSIDFLVDNRICLEADGDFWHRNPATKARDVRRDRELTKRGYVVIRLAEKKLKADPQLVIRALSPFGPFRAPDSRARRRQLSLPFTGS